MIIDIDLELPEGGIYRFTSEVTDVLDTPGMLTGFETRVKDLKLLTLRPLSNTDGLTDHLPTSEPLEPVQALTDPYERELWIQSYMNNTIGSGGPDASIAVKTYREFFKELE